MRKAIERHVPMRIIISLSVSPAAAARVDTPPICNEWVDMRVETISLFFSWRDS